MKVSNYAIIVALSLCCLLPQWTMGQSNILDSSQDGYVWPTDTAVLSKLDKWQDQKFGVLIHWGLYSVPGIVESWQICNEEWIVRPPEYTYEGYKDWYWGLCRAFNPTDFDPAQWARIANQAGMRYMIFTTKHHDGFCMYDSNLTDFSIAKGSAFADDPRSDVAREVFDAFRDKGFMVGCYFSKPDWHCRWYWNPYYATPNRRHNYRIDQHPDWWQKYVAYSHGQLEELMSGYGPFDILWLDGGWVIGDEVGLDEILDTARREYSPGLISVDRTIKGKNENYQTPERSVPVGQILNPWESCIPLSDDWGWTPNPRYKTPAQVVSTLAEIVAKGGCMALGVGPNPQGVITTEIEDILTEIGKWLEVNGEAIYGTRPTENYHQGDIWFTASKDGKTLYGIYTPEEGTTQASLQWEGNAPVDGYVTMLDGNKKLKVNIEGSLTRLKLPHNSSMPIAFKFRQK